MKIFYPVFFALLLVPFMVQAHPGRTASDGYHYCRTRCDYWGVPWNQRHNHIPNPQRPTIRPTPRPTPLPTPKPETGVMTNVQDSQAAYYKNPHWFREKLINDLVNEFGSQYIDIIARLVYTLLPDVKN